MKQPQQRLQHPGFMLAHLLWIICVLFSIEPAVAAEESCQSIYKQLDDTFDRLLDNRRETAASLYEIKLHALEDNLFEAFKQCPRHSSLYALMGELQIVLQQPSLAVAYANKAIQLDAASWRGHYVRGTGLCLTGDCVPGLASLRHAIALQPGNVALQLNLCSVLVWNGLYEESLPECTAVIHTGDPAVLAQAYYLRGQAYKALGNMVSAEADLDMAKAYHFDESQDVLQIVTPESLPRGVTQ